MYETIIITAAVGIAGAFLARRLYRILSGRVACQCSAGCLCSEGAGELKELEVFSSTPTDCNPGDSREKKSCSCCHCCMNGNCSNSLRFKEKLEQRPRE